MCFLARISANGFILTLNAVLDLVIKFDGLAACIQMLTEFALEIRNYSLLSFGRSYPLFMLRKVVFPLKVHRE